MMKTLPQQMRSTRLAGESACPTNVGQTSVNSAIAFNGDATAPITLSEV
jgi:hypothetical protein